MTDEQIPLQSQKTNTRNEQKHTKNTRIRMDDKRKDEIYPKGTMKMIRPKQLQTHNLPTDDVENINSANNGRDLLLANKPRFVPLGAEMMPQWI